MMKKIKKLNFLIMFFTLISVSLVLATSLPSSPNFFMGGVKILIDGAELSVREGTSISAYLGNIIATSGTIYGDSNYDINVSGTDEDDGKKITFKIGDMVVDQILAYEHSAGFPVINDVDLTITDKDDDGYSIGYLGYEGDDIDCDDENADINPGVLAETVCDDGKDNDCDGSIDENDEEDCLSVCVDNDEDGYGAYESESCPNEGIDCNDENADINPGVNDIPADGTDQDCDGSDAEQINGNEEDIVKEGITDFNLIIGDSEELVGEEEIKINDGDNPLVVFEHNFSESTLDLTKIVITVINSEDHSGIIINGIDLQSDQKKTVYVTKKDSSSDKVCIKDEDNLTSITVTELATSPCTDTESNEYLISCDVDGIQTGDYTCTDKGDRYEIKGLSHSGIIENTYTPPAPTPPSSGDPSGGSGSRKTKPAETEPVCKEVSRTCTDWGVCTELSGMSRSCNVVNECDGQIQTKVEWEEQPCTYEEPEEQIEEIIPEQPAEEPQVEEQEGFFSRVWSGIRDFPTTTGAVVTERTGLEMTGKQSWIIPAVIFLVVLCVVGLQLKVPRRIRRRLRNRRRN